MDRMKEGVQKRYHRFQQIAVQNVGLAEKKDELQRVGHVEARIQRMLTAIKSTKQNIASCLRTGNKEEQLEKRKRKLEEHQAAIGLHADAKELDNDSLIAEMMNLYADALDEIVQERLESDTEIEKKVLDAFSKYHEQEKGIAKIKKKLASTALDAELTKKRLATATTADKEKEIQDEYEAIQSKVNSLKDNVIADMYTLAAKEIDIANIFNVLVEIQTEYHRTAVRTLENILPNLQRKVATHDRRPVFGCPLEDHLRYSQRKISLVLEVCCSALCGLGLKEEGLFRVNGNKNRVRRLRAAFDAHELDDLKDYQYDPHSLCSALKLYLRELPDSLMPQSLQRQWLQAASMDVDQRITEIHELIRMMPTANRDNLAYLIKFLRKLLANEEYTRMNVNAIAIVFGPNLFGRDGDQNSMLASRFVDTLLVYADQFFPDEIDFSSSFTTSFTSRLADDFGGFDAGADQRPPKSVLAASAKFADSTHEIVSQSTVRRPKPPAPPPPPAPPTIASIDELPPPTTSIINIDDTIMSRSLDSLSKSPSLASNDSMAEYAMMSNNDGGGGAPDSSSNSREEIDRILPELREHTARRSTPARPPPPTVTHRGINVANSTRPASYMHAVDSYDANGTGATTPRPPIAPRRSHMKTSSVDENRTILSIPDQHPATIAERPTKPPLPLKPEVTKL